VDAVGDNGGGGGVLDKVATWKISGLEVGGNVKNGDEEVVFQDQGLDAGQDVVAQCVVAMSTALDKSIEGARVISEECTKWNFKSYEVADCNKAGKEFGNLLAAFMWYLKNGSSQRDRMDDVCSIDGEAESYEFK